MKSKKRQPGNAQDVIIKLPDSPHLPVETHSKFLLTILTPYIAKAANTIPVTNSKRKIWAPRPTPNGAEGAPITKQHQTSRELEKPDHQSTK